MGGTTVLRNDPDRDWERYGAEDPYYSILNAEAYRRHRMNDALINEIFQSGESTIHGFMRFAEERFGAFPQRSALEYGCGVGRLLIPLSERFETVTGVDVSPSMLREAKRHCRRTGARNVRLIVSDDELSGVKSTFDFIVSFLVLQHIPVRRGEMAIWQLLSRLNPSGVAALHFTTHRTSSFLRHLIHILRRNFLPLHWVGNLISGMRWNEPLMQTNLYDLERVVDIASGKGIHTMEATSMKYGDHAGVMLYLRRGSEQ